MEEGRKIKGNWWQELCLAVSDIPGGFSFLIFSGLETIFLVISTIYPGCNSDWTLTDMDCDQTFNGIFFITASSILFVCFCLLWYFLAKGVKKYVIKMDSDYQFFHNAYLFKVDNQGKLIEWSQQALLKDEHKVYFVDLPFVYSSFPQNKNFDLELVFNWEKYEIIIVLTLQLKIFAKFNLQEVVDLLCLNDMLRINAYFNEQLKYIAQVNQDELHDIFGKHFNSELEYFITMAKVLKLIKFKCEFSNAQIEFLQSNGSPIIRHKNDK